MLVPLIIEVEECGCWQRMAGPQDGEIVKNWTSHQFGMCKDCVEYVILNKKEW